MEDARRNRREKSAAVLLGLALGLVALEVMLRILGVACERRGPEPSTPARGDQRTILCLGDSFTWGMGASADMTWPRQLERLLNAGGGQRYVVVNRGMAGQNSTWLLTMLKGNLEATRPDLVILCTGSSNSWDPYGSPPAGQAPSQAGGVEPKPDFASKVRDQLYRVRVFRLAKLLYVAAREAREKAAETQRLAALEEARRAFQAKVVREIPQERVSLARDCFQKGREAQRSRRVDEAAECFRQGIAANPYEASNYLGLAEGQAERFDYPKVVEWCRKALEADPYATEPYLAMAVALISMHQAEPALECLARARELAPKDPGVLSRLSESFARLQRFPEALACLDQALACGPQYRGVVLQARASVYELMQEYDRAIADTLEVMRAGQNPERSCRTLGDLYLRKGEPLKAIPFYQQGLQRRLDINLILGVARCYKNLRRMDQALKYFEWAASVSESQAAKELADCYREAGQEAKAMEWYRRALKLRPDSLAGQIRMNLSSRRANPRGSAGPGSGPAAPVRFSPVEAWIRADLAKAIALCRQSGALVLMHDYPGDEVRRDVLRAIASENGVPFVDHHPTFRVLTDPEKYFAPDMHCNDLGYGLMARDLLPKVVELLPTRRPVGR